MENEKDIEEKLNAMIDEKLIKRGFFDSPIFASFRDKKKEFIMHADFRHELGADSMDIAILFTIFEKEFNIKTQNDETERIRTVSQAKNYIRRKLAQATVSNKRNPDVKLLQLVQ